MRMKGQSISQYIHYQGELWACHEEGWEGYGVWKEELCQQKALKHLLPTGPDVQAL